MFRQMERVQGAIMRKAVGKQLLTYAHFNPDARVGMPVHKFIVKRRDLSQVPILHLNKENRHWRSGGVGRVVWNQHWVYLYGLHCESYELQTGKKIERVTYREAATAAVESMRDDDVVEVKPKRKPKKAAVLTQEQKRARNQKQREEREERIHGPGH
jgi:hypothetical protein